MRDQQRAPLVEVSLTLQYADDTACREVVSTSRFLHAGCFRTLQPVRPPCDWVWVLSNKLLAFPSLLRYHFRPTPAYPADRTRKACHSMRLFRGPPNFRSCSDSRALALWHVLLTFWLENEGSARTQPLRREA